MPGTEAGLVLGLISSTIAIIDASKKVYEAAKDTKGLPEAFREVAGRLPIIKSILRSAKQNIGGGQSNNDSCKGVKHVVEDCEEKAKKLKELFDKVFPGEDASRMERYRKAVKVLGKGHRVEKLMQGILQDVYLLAGEKGINSTSKAQQEQILRAIADIAAVSPSVPEHEFQEPGIANTNYGSGAQYNAHGENIAQGNAQQFNTARGSTYNTGGGPMTFGGIQNIQNISNSRPNEDEAEACLSALFLTNPRDDREKLINDKGSRVDGTCQWIKSHVNYKSWLCSESQLLWLSGGPGKGKTMLSIFLTEELEGAATSQNKLFLQYFCDNKDEKRNTAVAVLRGLIYQILQSRPKLFDHILPEFKIQKTSLFSFETLWRIFERMVCDPALETTNCVLDGLDECDEASLKLLLRRFAALFSENTVKRSACHLNLLVVSRSLPDFIQELLSSFPCISLDSNAETEISPDIEIFIKAKVKELSGRKHYPEALRVYVENAFLEGAQGTFLWIGIVAKELENHKATEVEEALKTFPTGLDGLYARMLRQIGSGRQENAAMILRWVVMAVRPLTLLELSFAVEPTVKSVSVPIDRDRRIRDQVSFCGYFLVIKGDEVGLIHQSAKDFLLRGAWDSDPELELFHVKEIVTNLEIARRCLDYLQSGALENSKSDVLSDVEHLSHFPLLSYAVLYWHEHARFLDCSEEIFDLSLSFYNKKSPTCSSWWEAYSESNLRFVWYVTPSFRLLNVASYLGILPLVQNLVSKKGWTNRIKRSSFLNKPDSHGMTALMWAAQGGHEAVVRLLLEKGAHIGIKNSAGETAMSIAVEFRHEATVQRLLLEKGVNINAKNTYGDTALMKAVGWQHEAIVQLLLEQGADIKIQNESGTTTLMKATESENKRVTQILLEQGADINFQLCRRKKGNLHVCAEVVMVPSRQAASTNEA